MWPFSRHPQDDFRALTERNHWLGWIGRKPAAAIRREIENMLRKQVPDAVMEWLHLQPEPYFLTGGRRLGANEKILVTRAGLAVGIECQVTGGIQTERLRGVFSWVAAGLNTGDRRDRVWLDLNAEMPAASQWLNLRLYDLDPDPIVVTSGEST